MIFRYRGGMFFHVALVLCMPGWVQPVSGEGPGARGAVAEMLQDAELTDVQFVDPDRGWAVGDRGVIWQTVDGGRHWELHRNRVDGQWSAMHFVDGQHGWIVGGRRHPYSNQSDGLVLATTDGGRRWNQVATPVLPALREVQFLDYRRGWAVGASSSMYPAGVFRTRDGGRSWTAGFSGTAPGTWSTADFHDQGRGVLAGHRGQLGWVEGNQVKVLENLPWGDRTVRSLRMASSTEGWLVGDRGLIRVSRDGGRRWEKPSGHLPAGIESQFDFHSIALQGNHCWIAGSPGSRVLHTADGGETWEVFSTPQSLPIRGLAFLDAQRGWAVGSLGTIMVTRDGGRNWRIQRRGGERVALMAIFSHADRVPWESLAALSGNQGYLSMVQVLDQAAAELGRHGAGDHEQALREAVLSVGGASSEVTGPFTFPAETLELDVAQIVKRWDRTSERPALTTLQERLVRSIRQWRPDVIVTDPASTSGQQPAAHLVHQLVIQAAETAGDRTVFPEQISVAGLEPWSVKKVLSRMGPGARGTVNISVDQLATRLGLSLADAAFVARGLVTERYDQVPTVQGFRLSINRLPRELGQQSIMSGIRLVPGGPARRLLTAPPVTNLEQLNRSVQKRRQVDQLLIHQDFRKEQAGSWLAQLQDLTRGMEKRQVAEVLYRLGYRYHESGQPAQAIEVFRRLVRDCPEHELVPAAYRYLIQAAASGEVAWRQHLATQPVVQRGESATAAEQKVRLARQADAEKDPGNDVPSTVEEAPPRQVGPIGPGTGSTVSGQPASQTWTEQAIVFGKQLQRLHPQLYSVPEVRFPLAAVARQRGLTRDADQLYQLLGRQATGEEWRSCAQFENWLTHRRHVAPKPTVVCQPVKEKPFLDGNLDETFWKSAGTAQLVTDVVDDNPWPAQVRFAADSQFLYLAIRCRKAAGIAYPTTRELRSRDTDLSGHDRVELWLDLDRDYQTYYRLVVDHRGWISDTCWGDPTWNPRWFVAASEDEQQWIVEAALPWSELAGQPPGQDDAWALAVQRVIPGVGFQSWTQPATVAKPGQRCGLLLFR